MGEYAKLKGTTDEIKIGTCEHMYYLRYEDVDKVDPLPGNVDPANDSGLYFRLPFPDEDELEPGEYDFFNRGVTLYGFKPDIPVYENGYVRYRNNSGLVVQIPCYHGQAVPLTGNTAFRAELKERDAGAFEMFAVLRKGDEFFIAIRCLYCGMNWSVTADEVWEYIPDELKPRLEKYLTKDADNAEVPGVMARNK